MPLLSIIVPVYQGSRLLDDTFEELMAFESQLPDGGCIEVIAVDDGSTDDSYEKILQNQKRHPDKIQAVKLSRNFGSTAASFAGLSLAQGDCVALIPQDLQEPLELYLRMYKSWQKGMKVNLPYRVRRDEGLIKKLLANTYHFLFQKLAIADYPSTGMGLYLIDRQVADEFLRHKDLMDPTTLIFTMGYPRELHPYHRQADKAKSNWTLSKKISYAIDNLISFTYLPMRLIGIIGVFVALLGFSYGAYIFIGKFTGWYSTNAPPGWVSIIVLLSFLQGTVMVMLGIMGEYLWRILESSRRRPPYLVDEMSKKKEEEEGKEGSDAAA